MTIAADLKLDSALLDDLVKARETAWINPKKTDVEGALSRITLTSADIDDAEARLGRFAPFLMKAFPETQARNGLIESPLTEIPAMKDLLNQNGAGLTGRLFLKRDSDLAVAGSVKARGGIYEVLCYAEKLALDNGLLKEGQNYSVFASEEFKAFFGEYAIHVGSTGNLGLSIGIMSAVLGFRVNVHMSADAKTWKKELLRSYGVNVIEYLADYGRAVEEGRRLASQDPKSYFVDDENSQMLFLGYSVAARRIKEQFGQQNIVVDEEHPLFVYFPCGVGGAPGGVCFGLHQEFGGNVYVFFTEPTQSPCMLLGLASGKHDEISVKDIGLSGMTAADGLAVARPSRFVGRTIEELLCGEFTVADGRLYDDMRSLLASEDLFVEPSACATFAGPERIMTQTDFLRKHNLTEKMAQATHIAWATGGKLVPETEREIYLHTHL